jgi:hypothetical protein
VLLTLALDLIVALVQSCCCCCVSSCSALVVTAPLGTHCHVAVVVVTLFLPAEYALGRGEAEHLAVAIPKQNSASPAALATVFYHFELRVPGLVSETDWYTL